MPSTQPNFLKLDQLDTKSLELFFSNQICAIVVPGFAKQDLSKQLYDWILNNRRIEAYHHEIRDDDGVHYLNFGVDRLGVSFNTTYNKGPDSEELKRYYQSALPGIQSLREACSPYLSPIDKLRLQFDELWPHHANVAAFENKKMFVGIGRIMDADTSHLAEEQPHFDSVPNNICQLVGQYSANIYLNSPEVGGELELWDMPPLPINDIDNAPLDYDWRSQLHESFLIKPNVGDLILINTRRAHAVRRFESGKRVSVQMFIGLKPDKSIVFWN